MVKPLDGDALSLVGNALAGEGTPSDATTHLSGRHGRFSIWISHVRELGKRGRGKRERRKGGAGCSRVPGGTALHCRRPSPATGNTEPADAATGVRCKRMGAERNGARVLGAADGRGFLIR
jgi:hypothetical protein